MTRSIHVIVIIKDDIIYNVVQFSVNKIERIPPGSQYQLCLKKKYTARPNEQ